MSNGLRGITQVLMNNGSLRALIVGAEEEGGGAGFMSVLNN